MTPPSPVVYVVEDDHSMQEALTSLLRSIGLEVKVFGSGREFLASKLAEGPACLVLDVRLPAGMSGLDVQGELKRMSATLPVIFITGHGDIPMSVRAMKAGALEFLTKPFRDQDLIEAIYAALERDRLRWEGDQDVAGLQERLDSLTSREREVLPWVVSGQPNKQIAAALKTSEVTLKAHRGNVMRKMRAESLADLVRMADKLKIAPMYPAKGEPGRD